VSVWQKSDWLYSELRNERSLELKFFNVNCRYSAVIALCRSSEYRTEIELDTNFRSDAIEHNNFLPYGSA